MRLPSSAPLAPGLPPLPRLQRQRRQTRADGSDSTSDSDSTPDSGSGSDSDSNSAPASTPTPAPPAAAAPQTLVLSHLSGAGSLSYTLEVTVDSQTLPVQLDTGSSDLWLASTRCSTSVCRSSANGEVSLFNPRGVTNAGANANLTFPQGAAAGPIVTSPSLYLGPGQALRIDGQAFVSAANVENFELGPGNFTGTLGLGPPAGSVVQAELYIQSGNTNPGNSESDYSSTGSVLPALLHGIPLGTRYFSLGLRRLPSEGGRGDSTLVLGGIDTNFVPSASAVYSEPVAQGPGVALGSDSNDAGEMVTSFRREPRWRTYLQSMSVDVGGENTSLPMQSKIGGDYPIALFSSATSYSLAPSSFLNAFYGAYGFQPSSDGGYYVPCTTMLNVTLQLGQSKIPVPIHPLDLSLKQQNDGSSDSSYCLGGFQAIEGPKGNLDGTAMEGADVVIGTAMMRSIYSVFICDSMNGTRSTGSSSCNPQIGFYPLVDNITQAWYEFDQVRVQKKSLGPDPKKHKSSSHGLSPGIKALIGVLCAVAGIVLIMLAVVLWMRRQRKQRHAQAVALKLQSRGEPKQASGFLAPAGPKPGGSSQVMSDKTPGSMGAAVPTVSRSARMSADSFHSPAESMRSNWEGNQLEHARQINLMNGVFDEDVGQPGDDDPAARAAAGVAANFGSKSSSPTDQGDTSTSAAGFAPGHYDPNDPYREAKKIKGAYLKRHPSFEHQLPGSDAADPFASDASPGTEPLPSRTPPAVAGAGAGAATALAEATARSSAPRIDTKISDPFASNPPTSGESEEESDVGRRSASGPSAPAPVISAPAPATAPAPGPAPGFKRKAAPATDIVPPPPVTRTPSAGSGQTTFASLDEPMQDLASLPGAQAAVLGTHRVRSGAADEAPAQPALSTPSPPSGPVDRTSPVSPASPSRSSPSRKPVPTEAPALMQATARALPQAPRPTEAETTPSTAQPNVPSALPVSAAAQVPAYPATAEGARRAGPTSPSASARLPGAASAVSAPASAPAPAPAPAPAVTPAMTAAESVETRAAEPVVAPASGLAPPLTLPSSVHSSGVQPTAPPASRSALPPVTTQAQQSGASSAPSIPSPLNPVGRTPPPTTRSPPASLRVASGPAPPRANLMSPPSMRAVSGGSGALPLPGANAGASASATRQPVLAPDLFFDPALLPPPLPVAGGRGDTNALAHQLYRATAGTTSAFNPSGSVSGTATPAHQWSPTSSLVSPTQSFTPAHHVRMRPAFLQYPQPQPQPSREEHMEDDRAA